MKDDQHGFLTIFAAIGILACAACILTFFPVNAAAIEIPPAVEKKTVELKQSNRDAGRTFTTKCGQCHKAPDPAQATSGKPDCIKGLSREEFASTQKYMANVRAGKDLYESRCGRCHALIEPGAHTADYWSKNLCTSDECFVKKLLEDEEQQLLLYLLVYSKKN